MSEEASTSSVTLNGRPKEVHESAASATTTDRSLLILYGSQTGTAQDTAERIGRAVRRYHFRARVNALDDYDRALLLDETLVIFVCATTGQGAEPANMRQFWQFLKRGDLPDGLLEDLQFTVFGLGDSSYPKFNWPAKKLQRRLEQLGATTFHPKGEADEQDYLGIDTALNPWLDGLIASLQKHYPLPAGLDVLPADARPPARMRVQRMIDAPDGVDDHHKAPDRTIWAVVARNDRATAKNHFQDTRYIELDLEQEASFEPGDLIELRPDNDSDDVDAFLTLLGRQDDADTPMEVTTADADRPLPHHWPRRITLRQLFTSCLDIFSVPSRSFFEWLAFFTTESHETDKLREFCSAEGQEDMYDYARRPRRTIFEVLQEFRSAKIPPEYFADIFPEMRPRQFSIASSCRLHPRRVDLLVAVVGYRTMMHKPRKGVCTSWLSTLRPGDRIPISFAPGSMRLPPDRLAPVIVIGPGTGIAPFRAFMQERKLQQANDNLVIFGCRSRSKDLYYAQEWEEAEQQKEVTLLVAASRDQEEKVYVQHTVKEHGGMVWESLERGAWLYISGAADKMPKAVRAALVGIAQKYGELDEGAAAQYVETLETSKRLQEETWS